MRMEVKTVFFYRPRIIPAYGGISIFVVSLAVNTLLVSVVIQ